VAAGERSFDLFPEGVVEPVQQGGVTAAQVGQGLQDGREGPRAVDARRQPGPHAHAGGDGLAFDGGQDAGPPDPGRTGDEQHPPLAPPHPGQ
jgi:hypothetical protein